ncbi:MAG: cytidine/deoxycytidylate deaminase family protein [archaeon]|nr:cytidine/deoxycytidylate deaminase family protein [archaeon]
MFNNLKRKYHKRPSWDDYFMGIVEAVSTRATCDRGRTAVVLVKDKIIIATGYVGSPMGMPHCDDVGHQMKKIIHEDERISQHCVRTNHGEVNAISLAARNGVSTEGATLYCKLEPCYTCAKMLINSGIIRVVCQKLYHAGQDSRELFKMAKIPVTVLQDTVEGYSNQ